MNKNDKKMIYVLLVIIIICSSVLIYKIDKTPSYDVEEYERIYAEYDKIEDIINSSNTVEETDTNQQSVVRKNNDGIYVPSGANTLGIIRISKIDISYPIIDNYTYEYLDIAPAKLAGPKLNDIGNLVIISHNNRNNEMFSNLHKLEKGDEVAITNREGERVNYRVYDKYEIDETDFTCLDQDTNGKKELTLLTCIQYKKDKRLVVKCVENV